MFFKWLELISRYISALSKKLWMLSIKDTTRYLLSFFTCNGNLGKSQVCTVHVLSRRVIMAPPVNFSLPKTYSTFIKNESWECMIIFFTLSKSDTSLTFHYSWGTVIFWGKIRRRTKEPVYHTDFCQQRNIPYYCFWTKINIAEKKLAADIMVRLTQYTTIKATLLLR
jgi:hypothetical protein